MVSGVVLVPTIGETIAVESKLDKGKVCPPHAPPHPLLRQKHFGGQANPLPIRWGVGEDYRLKLASNSSGATVAVPILPTTIPAAWLERMAASRGDAPPAIARVKEAMTVSPAPDTSNT